MTRRSRSQRRRVRPIAWGRWALYLLGRLLQVTGLVIGLVAATAFFGTPSTVAMLRMLLFGVIFFLAGWLLARNDPEAG